MAKSLVIVESPAKAKTINKYLGNDYIVKSSVGHIRDLPTAGQKGRNSASSNKITSSDKNLNANQTEAAKKQKAYKQLINRMGIDPEHHWQASYEILPGKEQVVSELKKAAENAQQIFLATDLDREGEAIAWHLREVIGGDPTRFKRVVFNEITQSAIRQAFADPGDIKMDRVHAQQARRYLDRVVGYMVSPLLWVKIARGLSAGRVQSVAVRLIAEREREIRAFIPEEYWDVHADLKAPNDEIIRFALVRYQGENFRPTSETETLAAIADLATAKLILTASEDKPTLSKPGAPFITSTLQQAASSRLGFSVKKTMMLAQRLYEAGHITYMRTDSTSLSEDALTMARTYLTQHFDVAYLPLKAIRYASKSNAQEAHEAIRPTAISKEASALKDMERDGQRLYELIWRQFLASQMTPARYLATTLTIINGPYELRAKGRVLQFDGYTRIQKPQNRQQNEQELPEIAIGTSLELIELDPQQHFTSPSPRYTEASLVKELEKRGIGRPSTYATIISTIQERGYVELTNRRFYAKILGEIVTDRLVESFHDLLDYNFTARMEDDLDEIAHGQRSWLTLLDHFYEEFKGKLTIAESIHGMRTNSPIMTEIDCSRCGRKMQIRIASTGVFLGCSGYNLPPKERCKMTINLIPGDIVVDADADEAAETAALQARRRNPHSGHAMESFLIDEKRKLHLSLDGDGYYEIETGHFKLKGYDGPSIDCDRCGALMELRTGRFGKYFACTNESCTNTRKLLKNGQPAPPKMEKIDMPELRCSKVDDHYVLRDGASGLFLAASQFPKNRETRAILVQELVPHSNQLPEKYHYLLRAPQQDGEGNPAIIRFARKTQTQYVMTEVAGKATGWSAVFDGISWQQHGNNKKMGASTKTKTTKKTRTQTSSAKSKKTIK